MLFLLYICISLVISLISDKPRDWKYWKHFIYSILYLTLLKYSVLFYIPVSPETQTNIKDVTGNLWKRLTPLFNEVYFRACYFLKSWVLELQTKKLLKKWQITCLWNIISDIRIAQLKSSSLISVTD